MRQRLIWLKLLRSSQVGTSLTEALVVTFILSIMVAVTTPPLILGVGSRIQARRTETAVTLAQKEIERIRLIVDKGDYTKDLLPPEGKTASGGKITKLEDISEVGPPKTITNENKQSKPCSSPNETGCFKITESSQGWWTQDGEFFIQTFRDEGVTQTVNNAEQIVVFRMGVRVYSKVAYAQGHLGDLKTIPAPLYLSNSSDSEQVAETDGKTVKAKHSQFPLAVVYTDFSRGDLVGSLESYHQFTD